MAGEATGNSDHRYMEIRDFSGPFLCNNRDFTIFREQWKIHLFVRTIKVYRRHFYFMERSVCAIVPNGGLITGNSDKMAY